MGPGPEGPGRGRHRAVSWYQQIGFETTGIGLLIVLGWCRMAVTLVQFFDVGRPGFNARGADTGIVGDAAGDVCSLAFIAVAAVITIRGLVRGRLTNVVGLVIVLAPWLFIEISRLVNHQPLTAVSLAYPLAATAIWLQPPTKKVWQVFGLLAIVTAAGSIVLAVFRPDLALLTGSATGAKGGLLGSLLAGPYLHSNVLGIALTLGLPFIFAIRHRALRLAGFVVVAGALVWSGSRSSQAAAAFTVLVYFLVKRFPWWRRIALAGAGVGVALIVALPLVVTDPQAFTRRGQIWQALLKMWAHQPMLGFGPEIFRVTPGLNESLGGYFQHAHNMMVQLLVVGGVAAVVTCALMLAVAWRGASSLHGAGVTEPLLFMIALLVTSSLEASHITVTLAGYLFWLPLLLLARTAVGEEDPPRPPERDSDAGLALAGPTILLPVSDATVVLPKVNEANTELPALPARAV